MSWILDQFPKWNPINRETYLDRLALRWSFVLITSFVLSFKQNLLWSFFLMPLLFNFH
jgi:hypothetical protein